MKPSNYSPRAGFYCTVWSGLIMLAASVSLPPPTGPYHVGVKKTVVEALNQTDSGAPNLNNISYSLLATVYYPTQQEPPSEEQPYLDASTAAYYEALINFTTGALASITTSSLSWNATSLATNDKPTLVFGPGGAGPPSEVYTTLTSDLASHGYTVVALDHPFEQPIVWFPNGTVLYGGDFNGEVAPPVDGWLDIYAMRVYDNLAILDLLPSLGEELGIPINATHVGMFGHSAGGSAAVGAQLELEQLGDSRVVRCTTLDGSFFGDANTNSSASDLGTPVFLLGNERHDEPDYDPSWLTFPLQQTGWWRRLLVTGTGHGDFSDWTIWKEVGTNGFTSVGPIDGTRQVNIMRTFTKASFDFTLLGDEEPILNGMDTAWPEVIYSGGSNGTA